ncbi:hypothetical protein ACFS5N_09640 [Mucilaginibacter ximonensis]|uniref:Integron-associated effector binding protein domain-containing protein n=1 Tax=Mucilaginibacter ximonensis TaxID=538021 RepID=A0ABW5YBR5_9SPHI
MPNLKFSYLYRDSSNYKNYGYVIIAAPANKTLEEIEGIIKAKLIDEQWFYTNEWQVPDLFFDCFNPNTDPKWHEFESIEFTDQEINCWIPIV